MIYYTILDHTILYSTIFCTLSQAEAAPSEVPATEAAGGAEANAPVKMSHDNQL